MALKMNQMKCPSCGANLEFDGDRDRVFCTYCGTPIVITDENRHEIVHRQIDEAAIERERRKLKEAELQNQNQKQDNDNTVKLIIIGFVFFIVWLVIMRIML